MDNNQFELLKKKIQEGPEAQLNEAISRGALKMSDEQIAVASLAFWMVYMAETDLNDVINRAWEISNSFFPSEDVRKAAKEKLADMIGGGRKVDVENLEYFSDKIKVHEAMFGKSNRTKVLWKLNDIRNDLSHNRIDKLGYNGKSLFLRETKEKLILDYLEATLRASEDASKSDFWNSLGQETKDVVDAMYEEAKRRGLI